MSDKTCATKQGMNTPHTAPAPLVELRFTAEHLALLTGEGASRQTHQLPLSLSQVVQMFGQRMPNALQLENAIAEVEDAIMPAGKLLAPGSQVLLTTEPLLLQLIQSATGQTSDQAPIQSTPPTPPAPQSATREALETLFSALAQQAENGATARQMPQTPQVAAALLILRECMHHWGLVELRYQPHA